MLLVGDVRGVRPVPEMRDGLAGRSLGGLMVSLGGLGERQRGVDGRVELRSEVVDGA